MAGKRDLDPEASPLHFFGAEVRRAREAAGMTLADLGALVPCDASTVSRIEADLLTPTERFAETCDEAFPHMSGWFIRFHRASFRWNGPHPRWFRDWVEEYEARATEIRWWEPLLVPGLAQTEDYARAILASWRRDDGDMEARLAARLRRQAIIDRDKPAGFRALIDESVLHRCIGGPAVMAGQLDHLVTVGGLANVTIQVVPQSARAYAGFSGAFIIASIDGEPHAAYLETGIRGMAVTDADLVRQAVTMFDDLRDEALSRPRSLELIAEVAKEWTRQATPAAGGSPATAEPTAAPVLRSVSPET